MVSSDFQMNHQSMQLQQQLQSQGVTLISEWRSRRERKTRKVTVTPSQDDFEVEEILN